MHRPMNSCCSNVAGKLTDTMTTATQANTTLAATLRLRESDRVIHKFSEQKNFSFKLVDKANETYA